MSQRSQSHILARLIQRAWPLPPQEHRKLYPLIPLLPSHVRKGIRVERDGDYLCYRAAVAAQVICLFLLVLFTIDAVTGFHWLTQPETLAKRYASFIDAWMTPVATITPVIVAAFYVRIRLAVDIKDDQIPIFVSKKALRGRSRRDFIQMNAFMIAVMLLVVSAAKVHTNGFLEMYDLENDLTGLAVLLLGLLLLIPFLVSLIISMLLLLEKSIRFFPEAQRDLENW